jgi:glutathione synthase
MKICFIIYPWERLNPAQDSSLRIIHESVKRKHSVFIAHSSDLLIQNGESFVNSKKIIDTKAIANFPKFYKSIQFEKQLMALREFDVIFMRDNPPVDMILLNFLDSVKDQVFIINSIDGIRKSNNKTYTATLGADFEAIIPKTYISKDVKFLEEIVKNSPKDKMILKPLDGYGGNGVIVLEKQSSNIKPLLDFYINREKGKSDFVILQEYVEGAEKGDVRVLLLGGKPVGSLRRVPAQGDMRSNISVGGKVEKHELTDNELKICDLIGEKLVKDGILYAGIDIIGDKLIEVNVLSPGTITDINIMSKTKVQVKILNYLEKMVKSPLTPKGGIFKD